MNFSRKLIQLPKKSIEAWPHGQRLLLSFLRIVGRMAMATFKMRAFIWPTKRVFPLSPVPVAAVWEMLQNALQSPFAFADCEVCIISCRQQRTTTSLLSDWSPIQVKSFVQAIFVLFLFTFYPLFFCVFPFRYFLLTICCWFLLCDGGGADEMPGCANPAQRHSLINMSVSISIAIAIAMSQVRSMPGQRQKKQKFLFVDSFQPIFVALFW